MEYNTQKRKLYVREYGRNIQTLVDKLSKIEDRQERLEAAYKTVNILKLVSSQYHLSGNSDQKIWDMLHYISNFSLDIDGPYPLPPKDNFEFQPRKLEYSAFKGKKKYHLGRNLTAFVEIAKSAEDEEESAYMTRLIAHYMRLVYFTWHHELPNDTFIHNEINQISGGKLSYDIETAPKANHYSQLNHSITRQSQSKHNHRGGNRYKRKR